MADIINFSEERAEKVLRAREAREEAQRQDDEQFGDLKLLFGDLDALTECMRGVSEGHWSKARAYLLTEIEIRILNLRRILGVE